MKVVDWINCDDRSTAKRVCDRLIVIGARIINVADASNGSVVWFEYEGEIDKDALLEGNDT